MERPFDRLTVLSNVEGHHIFAYMAAAPQNESIKAKDLVCACPETLSSPRWGRSGQRSLVGLNLEGTPQPPASEAFRNIWVSIESDEHVKSSTYMYQKLLSDFS